MNERNDFPPQLYDLVFSKEYSELDPGEKLLVNQWLSEVEYNSIRMAGIELPAIMQQEMLSLQPDTRVTGALKQKVANNKARPMVLKLLLTPLPLWQAAACVILLLGIFYMSGRGTSAITTLVVTDTVFIETGVVKPVTILDTIYSEIEKHFSTAATTAPSPGRSTPPSTGAVYLPSSLPDLNILTIDKKQSIDNYGKTLHDDTLAGIFSFVGM